MTPWRFTMNLPSLGCLWVLIASAIAAGILAGGLLLGALSPVAAPRSAAHPVILPSPSGRMTTERACPLPSPDVDGLRTGAPHDPASVSAAASGDARPIGTPSSPATGMRAASSEAPRSRIPLRGVATWFRSPSGVSAAGPTLRRALGPGWRGSSIRACAGEMCVVTVLGDWCACADRPGGPTVIDLDARLFARLAPLSAGVLRVTVSPETSTP